MLVKASDQMPPAVCSPTLAGWPRGTALGESDHPQNSFIEEPRRLAVLDLEMVQGGGITYLWPLIKADIILYHTHPLFREPTDRAPYDNLDRDQRGSSGSSTRGTLRSK
jgi:hypothetical protein